ncbi:MAG: hypothetical protein H6841_07035 [Planctomycetes bacterium]|nr:hypothetical protein [Planctomycetota bacterium]MCB9935273.1 hypothetical protein [Planctomycetota bacterium]
MGRRRKRTGRGFELRLQGKTARVAGVAFGVMLLAATIGCVLYSNGTQGSAPDAPPERSRPAPLERLDRVEGWVPYWADEEQIAGSARKAGFTDLLFFHGSVAADGKVKLEDEPGLKAGLAAAGELRRWLTVTNHGGSLAAPLSDSGMDDHADSLLAAFERSGCDHLDLDYESLSSTQAAALLTLAEKLAPRLPFGARLSFTLQPVDGQLRPEQADAYRRLLDSPNVYSVRLMMYDYHWRGSLPGALYPLPAYKRLLEFWAAHTHKLTLCLPLYGYDWPRPEDTSLPRAEVVTLRDVKALRARPGFDAVWMEHEAELAGRYDGHMVALPSLRAIQTRVELGLDWGVPAVSFWHLGCADPAPVRQVCERDVLAVEAIAYDHGEGWSQWIDSFKRRVCKVITTDGSRTLEELAEAHGVPRATMYRFNEQIEGGELRNRTVFVPK